MLAPWANYFTLTGTAGATLVGLLFVVVTLNTTLSTSRTLDIAHASMTPALYSFTDVLLQSMIVLAPWGSDRPMGIALVILGAGGLAYRLNRVRVRRTLNLKAIHGLVDRLFHNAVPVIASLALMSGGLGLVLESEMATFAVAGSSLLPLVSGIYRTWGETLALIGSR